MALNVTTFSASDLGLIVSHCHFRRLFPPILDLKPYVGTVQVCTKRTGIRQRRSRRLQGGGALRSLVPGSVGVIQTKFRPVPESRALRRPGRRDGVLSEFSGTVCGFNLVAPNFCDQRDSSITLWLIFLPFEIK